MAKEELIVKTTPLPQSRISFELEIPSETCKTCVNETINTILTKEQLKNFIEVTGIIQQAITEKKIYNNEKTHS